jgi:hypothetical protein
MRAARAVCAQKDCATATPHAMANAQGLPVRSFTGSQAWSGTMVRAPDIPAHTTIRMGAAGSAGA